MCQNFMKSTKKKKKVSILHYSIDKIYLNYLFGEETELTMHNN